MKDGGSRSPRPQRWPFIDPATPEPEVHSRFGFVSTVQPSHASNPLIPVRNPGENVQGTGSENADATRARQATHDGIKLEIIHQVLL